MELKDTFEQHYRDNTSAPKEKRIPEEDRLRPDDWKVLKATIEILRPLKDMTKRHEGNNPSFWMIESGLEYLESELTEQAELYADAFAGGFAHHDVTQSVSTQIGPSRHQFRHRISSGAVDETSFRFLRIGIRNAQSKLAQYRKLLKRSSAYTLAATLMPALKGARDNAEALRELLNDEYPVEASLPELSGLQEDQESNGEAPKRQKSGFHSWLYAKKTSQTDSQQSRLTESLKIDEVDRYVLEEAITEKEVGNIFEYWAKKEEKFPRVSRAAFDLLSIPPTSSECERIFSRSKLVVTTQRHQLQPLSLKWIVSLKTWARQALFRWGVEASQDIEADRDGRRGGVIEGEEGNEPEILQEIIVALDHL